MEENVQDLKAEIEQLRQKLRDLEEQLLQSEKMATLGQHLAGVAHDINTPLGALKSNADLFIRAIAKMRAMLTSQSLPDEICHNQDILQMFDNIEHLNEVNSTAANRIATIVDSLRRFARVTQESPEGADVATCLDGSLVLVHHELKNRVEVVKNYVDVAPIRCYPNQLFQVFLNLLSNAAQAIDGKGRITLTIRRDGDMAVVEIADTGSGIVPEHLDRIFQTGFTTKAAGEGTGLGLAIVKQIVDAHEGRIEVESERGKGTVFRLYFPLAPEKEP